MRDGMTSCCLKKFFAPGTVIQFQTRLPSAPPHLGPSTPCNHRTPLNVGDVSEEIVEEGSDEDGSEETSKPRLILSGEEDEASLLRTSTGKVAYYGKDLHPDHPTVRS